jgi:tetratricopeptide (TPR) repeat protein
VYDLQTLGALYLQKGNNLMALNYLEKALKLDPHHAPTLLNRTKALFALGYKKQGLSQAKALEKNPETSIADQATALLLAYS